MRILNVRTLMVGGELPANSMLLAATGRGVLTQSVRYLPGGASTEPGDFQLRLWTAGDLREVWHQDTAPGDIWRIAFSTDENLIYLMRPNAAEFFTSGAVASFGQGNTFGIFDLRTQRLIAERNVRNASLLPLWPGR